MPSLLNANSTERKTLEVLVIQVKNLLTKWETGEENHGHRTWDIKTQDKKPSNLKRETEKKNRELR